MKNNFQLPNKVGNPVTFPLQVPTQNFIILQGCGATDSSFTLIPEPKKLKEILG